MFEKAGVGDAVSALEEEHSQGQLSTLETCLPYRELSCLDSHQVSVASFKKQQCYFRF